MIGGRQTPPIAGGRPCRMTVGDGLSRMNGWRAQVCHYPMAIRARALAHRTGFSRSGNAVLRRSAYVAAARLKGRGLVRQLSDVYALCLTCVGRVRMSSARWVSQMPPGLFMSAGSRVVLEGSGVESGSSMGPGRGATLLPADMQMQYGGAGWLQ